MGIYMNSISGGNTIGPLICGFVVESIGWRWHKWMAVIFTGINFVAVLLFVPETQHNRDISKSLGSEASFGTIQVCQLGVDHDCSRSEHYILTSLLSPTPARPLPPRNPSELKSPPDKEKPKSQAKPKPIRPSKSPRKPGSKKCLYGTNYPKTQAYGKCSSVPSL